MAPPPRREKPTLLPEDPDWSTLPEELLECIGKMLPSRREAVKFRSICPAWRAALPFARYIAPVLMLPFNPNSLDGAVTFYTAAYGGETTFKRNLPSLQGKRLCGSSRGWLALVDEAASVTLLNPLTGATVELPPADERVVAASFMDVTVPNGSQWVPLPPVESDWGLLRPFGSQWCLFGVQETIVRLGELKKSAIRQIVLSSSSPGSGDFVAMASLTDSGTVAFCRVGVDGAWTLLDTNLPVCPITSVVHFRGSTFLAIYDGGSGGPGGISICDVPAGAAPTATRVEGLYRAPKLATCVLNYFEVNGQLYVVAAVVLPGCTHLTNRVYKCNVFAERPRWTRVKNTHGLTFLMSSTFTAGYGGAASVSGFISNSIYSAKADLNRDLVELEIIDIANGTSEFHPSHENIQGSEALCWIQPNHWA